MRHRPLKALRPVLTYRISSLALCTTCRNVLKCFKVTLSGTPNLNQAFCGNSLWRVHIGVTFGECPVEPTNLPSRVPRKL